MSRSPSPCHPTVPYGSHDTRCKEDGGDETDCRVPQPRCARMETTRIDECPASGAPLWRSHSPLAADAHGERPRKHRHLEGGDQVSRAARRYVDLEAEDADSDRNEDGSDTEMVDFLDGSPLADLCDSAYRAPRSRSPEDDAQELLAIAEAIRARARQRIRDDASPATVDLEQDTPPMPYLVSMKANARLEQKLIRWLQGSVPGVVSVVSHGMGSGRIYVTARHYACLKIGLRGWPLSWNLSEAQLSPVKMTPFEYELALEGVTARQALLDCPPDPKPGTWARFATDVVVTDTGFISMAGDLVVLLGNGLALSVPRIPSRVEECAADVPPRLCLLAALVQAFPHTAAQIITEPDHHCWIWGGRCFRESGLEVFTVDAAEITMVGVEPTEDERELFASSRDPLLCRPSLAHPAWALQAGDRVVLRIDSKVVGGHLHSITAGDGGISLATVLPDEPSSQPEMPASNNVPIKDVAKTADPDPERTKSVCVPVDRLRLHLLATPRTLSHGHRILVVAGPHIGTYGHITETIGPRTLSIEASVDGLTGSIFVDRRHVQVCFRLGDAVEVIRGVRKGVTGFIVAMYKGGYVEVYPIRRGCADPLFCRLRTLDIRLVPTETAASGAAPSVIQPGEVGRLQHERDRQREAWEDDMRRMGQLLRNMEVRVVRKHREKTLYGTIVDYRQLGSQPPNNPQPAVDSKAGDTDTSIDSILGDVQLQIRLEGEGRQTTVTSAQVVERSTGLPVEHAALLKAQKLLPLFAREETSDETSDPDVQGRGESDVTWGIPSSSQLPLEQRPVVVPDIGEETGHWLAHYQLIDKRVDVFPVTPQQLADINLRTPQLKRDRKINGKTGVMSRLERGRAGYLVPLTEGVPPSKVPAWSVWCKFPPSYNAKMCVVTLRPCRQTDVDRHNPVAKCISSIRGRVIIIGPDIDGNKARLGDYAETILPEDGQPTTLVNVRFPKERDFSGAVVQPTGRYHIVCLCRALNSVVPGAENRCHVTDFDAAPAER